ncbi:MAG: hypothetical protein OXH19_02305 [Chloroflexi bacterium]|nr:hypothetical protein [Chloroflexota bacterium]MCY3587782.1 hypothetical protein [Chloroflexota bacterium]MCY3607298.1 hypothetical protein [Acidimicrobiaceae bacterium]MDE2709011.1 hypothetical protein [Chloroflexota bacterium]
MSSFTNVRSWTLPGALALAMLIGALGAALVPPGERAGAQEAATDWANQLAAQGEASVSDVLAQPTAVVEALDHADGVQLQWTLDTSNPLAGWKLAGFSLGRVTATSGIVFFDLLGPDVREFLDTLDGTPDAERTAGTKITYDIQPFYVRDRDGAEQVGSRSLTVYTVPSFPTVWGVRLVNNQVWWRSPWLSWSDISYVQTEHQVFVDNEWYSTKIIVTQHTNYRKVILKRHGNVSIRVVYNDKWFSPFKSP